MSTTKTVSKRKYYWMIIYFLFGSAIPLFLFLVEFLHSVPQNMDVKTRSNFDDFIPAVLTTYSPLFIYALLAGFFLPLYIVPAYDFFKKSIRDHKINRIRNSFMLAAIGISILVTFADFFSGDSAIWEIKPPKHQPFVDQFVNATSSTTSEAKKIYKNGIDAIITKGVSNWSLTKFSYAFSVFVEAFFLNIFFSLSVLYSAFRRALRREDELEFYKRVNGLVISSLLIFVWLLLRTVNGIEKMNLYPDAALQVADMGVGLLNIFCLFIIILARITNRKVKKIADEILNFAGALGVTIGSVFAYFHKDMLVMYFGKKAALSNYLVFPIVLACIYIAFYAFAISSEYNTRNNIRPSEDEI